MDPATQLLIAKIAVPGAIGVAGLIMTSRYFSMRKRHAWPTTQGTIVSSKVGNGMVPGRRGKSFEAHWAEVEFRFSLNGKEYSTNTIAADRIHFRTGDQAETIAKLYHPEQQVQVYYNPDNHEEAYLVPGGAVGGLTFLVMGLILLGGDAALTWWFLSIP
ncbi:MAG: DUF3592 domain-containing protein [Deltaproteobacteria bacterium]|nr:DUF3592 domain-containing protein [Deltaproteobacteria bacterium]MBW1871244.1 DUF3592 domain-containing protein [Deltaproteobacteria bacterium]